MSNICNLFTSSRCLRIVALALTLIVLVGCGAQDHSAGQPSPSMDVYTLPQTSETPSSADTEQQELPRSFLETEWQRNQALAKVQGLEELPADCVMGVKNYNDNMSWMEANSIAELKRYAVESGAYFLIVPQYTGSSVTVQPLRLESGGLVAGDATYHLEECPDDYALIVNSRMPEGAPDLRVTVSYGTLSGSYEFRYDGRGDIIYPVIQDGYFLVAEDAPPSTSQIVEGFFEANIDHRYTGSGYDVVYTAMVPAHWNHYQHPTHRAEIDVFSTEALNIAVWGYIANENNSRDVKTFLGDGEVSELRTGAGNTIYRLENDYGNLDYSFALEDGLCVMVQFSSNEGYPPPTNVIGDCDAALYRFRDSIEVQMTWNESQQQ